MMPTSAAAAPLGYRTLEVAAAAEHGDLLVLVAEDRTGGGQLQADLAWALARRMCRGTLRACPQELRRTVCETRMSLMRHHLGCDYA